MARNKITTDHSPKNPNHNMAKFPKPIVTKPRSLKNRAKRVHEITKPKIKKPRTQKPYEVASREFHLKVVIGGLPILAEKPTQIVERCEDVEKPTQVFERSEDEWNSMPLSEYIIEDEIPDLTNLLVHEMIKKPAQDIEVLPSIYELEDFLSVEKTTYDFLGVQGLNISGPIGDEMSFDSFFKGISD